MTTLVKRAPVQHFSAVVSNADIAARDYVLTVTSHVEAEDTRELVDAVELNARIASTVARQMELRTAIGARVSEFEDAS